MNATNLYGRIVDLELDILILLVVATVLAVAFGRYGYRRYLLRFGRCVQATVVQWCAGRAGKSGETTDLPLVEYVVDGRSYRRLLAAHNSPRPQAVGDAVTIHCSRRNPARCIHPGSVRISQNTLAGCLLALFFAVGLFLVSLAGALLRYALEHRRIVVLSDQPLTQRRPAQFKITGGCELSAAQ